MGKIRGNKGEEMAMDSVQGGFLLRWNKADNLDNVTSEQEPIKLCTEALPKPKERIRACSA